MKRLLTAAVFAAALVAAPSHAQNLDQLLDQVKSGALQKSKSAVDLEKRFRSAGAGKAGIVNNLKAERARLEARSDTFEAQFTQNNDALDALRTQRQASLGDLKDLFGAMQQVVGETTAMFDTSLISAQLPDRSAGFASMAQKLGGQSNDLVSAADVEKLWTSMVEELVQQGKVAKFTTNVATSSGASEQQEVVRVGAFNLIGDGKYLTFGKGGVAELPRQPDGRYQSVASALFGASGEGATFSLDPTLGKLLEAAVENPSLGERINQGGLIGKIILSVGGIAVLIAVWRIITLIGVASAVNKQAKNPDNPSSKNPLGRVLKAVTDNPTNDTEAMELRLSEAIMKETPKLTAWLMFLKIVSVVAPLGGLLGTVWGMIETFQSITLFGAGDPRLMAGGISKALVTTVCGLVVAIPTVLLHTAAASRAKRVEEILEEQSAGMVARQIEK